MRNNARLKRFLFLLACLLLILIAALLTAKKTASEPELKPVTQQPFIGPLLPAEPIKTATPPAAKQKQIQKTKPAAAIAQPAPIKPVPVFATQAEAKAYLNTLLFDNDYKIMVEVIQCESGWSQYWEPGSKRGIPGTVKVAGGNVGFGQINRGAHFKKFEKLGIDIYSDKGNLDATVQLYKQQGINPWKPYSGHCFLPKLKAAGINL